MKTIHFLTTLLLMALLFMPVIKAQNADQPPSFRSAQFLQNQAYNWTAEAQRVLLAASTHTYTDNGISTASVTVDVLGFVPLNMYVKNDATSTDTLYISNSALFPLNSTFKLLGAESFNLPVAWGTVYIKFGYVPVASKAYRFYAY